MANNGGWHNGSQPSNGNGHGNGHGNGRSARNARGSSGGTGWRIARRRRHGRLERRGSQVLLLIGGLAGIGLLSAFLVSIILAIQVGTVAFLSFQRDLPSINQIQNHQTFKTAQIYDRKGVLLWEFYDAEGGRRTVVPLSDISQYLIDATLAAEDATFYDNPGVDPKGIARAFLQNLRAEDTVSGASTITQQLVRNVILDPVERNQRSMTRKIREALLAFQVNDKYSKSQVLQLYLNEIYYGNLAYGVEAAAQAYFAKSAHELTLPEAALIAGLPQAPASYDPFKNPAAAKERQIYVLDQMERWDLITPAQAEEAKRTRLTYTSRQQDLRAPHWVMYVRDLVEQRYGPRLLYQGGLKIYTTLDYELDLTMQDVARQNAPVLAQRDANNTSIVVANPKTGEILSLVGSMDYYNRDIDGQVTVPLARPGRQPGSSIKPLVYLTAFQRDWVPSTVIQDSALSVRDDLGRVWTPLNFDKKFYGNVTLRTALGNSLNIPAVRVLQHIGIDAAVETIQRLGISTWTDRSRLGLSLTLGGAEVLPLELTGAYATLANNGLRIPLTAITKIVDSEGNVIEDYKVPQGEQIVDPRAAYMVTNILSDNNARLITYGPNSLLKTERPSAAKTGTTDNYRDTWTMGYTPNLVVGVWVGNTDGRPMREVLSSMSAGKIWRESLDTAAAFLNLPPEPFARPAGLTEVEVCGDGAMRPGQGQCYREIFKVERAPSQPRTYLPGATPPTPTPGPATPTPESTPGQATPQPARTPIPVEIPVLPPLENPSSPRPPRAQPTPRPAQPKPGQRQQQPAPTRSERR